MRTIKQLYDYNMRFPETAVPMLSNYDADFWQEYLDNFTELDDVFVTKFAGYYFYNAQDYANGGDNEDIDISVVFSTFRTRVKNILFKNTKKYA